MIRKGNVTIGLQTRFGPDWTGIRCGARTKLGGECQRPAVKKTGRCTRHGGKSTGPRTQAGRNKIAALHTTHGKYTKAKRQVLLGNPHSQLRTGALPSSLLSKSGEDPKLTGNIIFFIKCWRPTGSPERRYRLNR